MKEDREFSVSNGSDYHQNAPQINQIKSYVEQSNTDQLLLDKYKHSQSNITLE